MMIDSRAITHSAAGFTDELCRPDAANPWHRHAHDLARWAAERLVNRSDRFGGYGSNGPSTLPPGPITEVVSPRLLEQHFRATAREHVVGLHAIAPDNRGRWVCLDIDAHDGHEFDADRNEAFAKACYQRLRGLGFRVLMYGSNGRGGYHLWVLFDGPVPSELLHSFGRWAAVVPPEFAPLAVESFPKQPALTPTTEWGSWMRIPGRHHSRDVWPRAWDGSGWLSLDDTVVFVLSLDGDSVALIPPEAYPELAEPTSAAAVSYTPPTDGTAFWVEYNRKADFSSLLQEAGAKPHGSTCWTRPGKGSGASASLGHRTDPASGCPLLYVFSSNWPSLRAGRYYTPFDFVVCRRHGRIDKDANRETIRWLQGGSSSAVAIGSARPPFVPPATPPGGAVARPPARIIPAWTPFPTDTLPEVVADLATAAGESMNCDPSYAALPALAALGAAIGASHAIELKESWLELPYLWCLTVGRSGAGKSPPFKITDNVCEDINDDLECKYQEEYREYVKAVEEHKALTKAYKQQSVRSLAADPLLSLLADPQTTGDPDPGEENFSLAGPAAGIEDPGRPPCPPVEKAFSKGDTTIEALITTLGDNPRGIIVANDELDGWLKSFTRYAKSGGSDLPNWLSLHSAGKVSYDRKTGDHRKIRVRGVGVSVTGTIQPGVLKRVMTPDFREAGLLARLLLTMPPVRPRRWKEAIVPQKLRDAFGKLLRELYQLPPAAVHSNRLSPHMVRLTEDAKILFINFFESNGVSMMGADDDTAAAMSKLEAAAARFALIFHCCRFRDRAKDEPIGRLDMENAIRLATWFRDEAERVYACLAESETDTLIRSLFERVLRLAERHGGDSPSLSARELQNSNTKKYPKAGDAEADLQRLVDAGLCRFIDQPPPRTGGHPTRRFYPTSDTSDTRGSVTAMSVCSTEMRVSEVSDVGTVGPASQAVEVAPSDEPLPRASVELASVGVPGGAELLPELVGTRSGDTAELDPGDNLD